MTDTNYKMLPVQALAYVGDAVYELYVRKKLVDDGIVRGDRLHHTAAQYVSASAQSLRLRAIEQKLTSEEIAIFKRGRNAKVGVPPKSASVAEYRCSTGLETLIGYLFLQNETERLEEIIIELLNAKI